MLRPVVLPTSTTRSGSVVASRYQFSLVKGSREMRLIPVLTLSSCSVAIRMPAISGWERAMSLRVLETGVCIRSHAAASSSIPLRWSMQVR